MLRPAIVPLALGLALGWLIHSQLTEKFVSPDAILSAVVTIGVGWWIESALRRRSELDRVPLETVSRLCERIQTLVDQCLDRAPTATHTDSVLVQTLRLLGNEIHWMGEITEALNVAKEQHERLQERYWNFKGHLTLGPEVNLILAADESRRIRLASIQIQWMITNRILEKPDDIGPLGLP